MANNIVHFEISVEDMDRAKKFYETVFGWAFNHIKEMNYMLVYPGGEITDGPPKTGINGGMLMRNSPAPDSSASPNAYVCTVSVDDIDDIVAKAEAGGARVDMPVHDVQGVGRLAYIRDTEMNLVGLLEPMSRG